MTESKRKRKVSSQALVEKSAKASNGRAEAGPGVAQWPRAYFERTRAIFEDRARKQAKADQAAKKALLGLVEEAQADLTETIDHQVQALRNQAKKNTLVRQFRDQSEALGETIDGWLDRLGLVRKSRMA